MLLVIHVHVTKMCFALELKIYDKMPFKILHQPPLSFVNKFLFTVPEGR